MEFIKKHFTGIALFFFLIILPFGSFLYLRSGLDFYKENMEEMKVKGVAPQFELTNHLGEVIRPDSLLGKIHVASFINENAPDNKQYLTRQLARVQEQFKNRKDVILLTHTSDSTSSKKSDWISRIKPINSIWHFLDNTPVKNRKLVLDGYKVQEFQNNYSPQFVLVDDSLNIRGYYNGLDSLDVNKMIIHISLIMPRKPKEKIVYKPEKEK